MKARITLLVSAVVLTAFGVSARAEGKSPVVVELFTSQGCSSCPPANAALIDLSRRADVLALSFSVTYWDRLGWKDSFGKQQFTDRQAIYEPRLGENSSFTPQIVVNGRLSAVGSDRSKVEGLIARASGDRGPAVSIDSGRISVGAGQAQSGAADVWLVRYDPNVVNVPVGRGENSGRTLAHTHVVHELRRIGAWNGAPASFEASGSRALKTAVLVQGVNGGPILAAATD